MATFDVTLRLPDGREETETTVAADAAAAADAARRRAAWICGVAFEAIAVTACRPRGDAEPDLFAPRRAA